MLLKCLVLAAALVWLALDVINALPRVRAERSQRQVIGTIVQEQKEIPAELRLFKENQIYRVIAYDENFDRVLVSPEWERSLDGLFYSNNKTLKRLTTGTRFKVDYRKGIIVLPGEASA